ncbi:MAG: type IV pilus inner membrane component PilO [Bacillota bacterium]
MFSKLSKRDRMLLVVMLGIALVFAVYKIILTTQWPQFQEAKNNLEAAKAALQSAQAEAATLEKLQEQVVSAQDDVDRVKTLFEIKVGQGAPFMELGAEAIGSGVHLVSLYPEPVVTDEVYESLPMKLSVRGTYSQVLDFIHRIENMASLAEIGTVKLTVDTTTVSPGEESQVVAEMTMYVYGSSNAPLASIPDERLLGRAEIFDPVIKAAMQVAGAPGDGSGGSTGSNETGATGGTSPGGTDTGQSGSGSDQTGGTGSSQPSGSTGSGDTGSSGGTSSSATGSGTQNGTGNEELPVYK